MMKKNNFSIRACDYLKNYGTYPVRSEFVCEISEPILPSLQINLEQVVFNVFQKRMTLSPIRSKDRWQFTISDTHHFSLNFDLDPGYYLLSAHQDNCTYSMPIVVCDYNRPADIAVIRPIFTQWSYHWQGFYFNENQWLADRLLRKVGHLGIFGRVTERVLRHSSGKLCIRGINFPYKPFPAHPKINLAGFYRRNNRWDKTIWDVQMGQLEGLWVDEILCGMPIFALLDKNHIPYHVFTDIDLHNKKEILEKYRILVFSGQEGITPTYYQFLRYLQAAGKTSFLLWGVQGFGYRQLDYNSVTGELMYVCTRGRQGMWGDQLEDSQPEWGDEGLLFGFHFPEPSSASWRKDSPYSRIVVPQSDHPIVRISNTSGKTYHYEIRDHSGGIHPGLTWAGGELQRRVAKESKVIAYLDDAPDSIGIGEYKNTVIFSPTYLPAFFAYEAEGHPEVELWFMAALDYLFCRGS